MYDNAQDFLFDTPPGCFAVVRCLSCGLTYLCPRPAEDHLGDYYPPIYPAYNNHQAPLIYKLYHLLAPIPYRLFHGSEKGTLKPFGQRRMLDVGCGAGGYLYDMQRLGWNVYGVDVSDIAVDVARARIGSPQVYVGTIESLEQSLDKFDLITMNHSLEHMAYPNSTLHAVYQRLTGNGMLKVTVPDVSGFEARVFGRYWVGLDVPRHLVDFSKRTLIAVLQENGFHIESWRPQFFPYIVYGSFDVLLKHKLHIRWRLLRYALDAPIVGLALLSYSLGNRGAIEVIARKQ